MGELDAVYVRVRRCLARCSDLEKRREQISHRLQETPSTSAMSSEYCGIRGRKGWGNGGMGGWGKKGGCNMLR